MMTDLIYVKNNLFLLQFLLTSTISVTLLTMGSI